MNFNIDLVRHFPGKIFHMKSRLRERYCLMNEKLHIVHNTSANNPAVQSYLDCSIIKCAVVAQIPLFQ